MKHLQTFFESKLIELRQRLLSQSVLYNEAQINIFNRELKDLFDID
jgi:hypothetical protein